MDSFKHCKLPTYAEHDLNTAPPHCLTDLSSPDSYHSKALPQWQSHLS